MKINKFTLLIISLVSFPAISIVCYGGYIIWLTWPISEVSINKAGVFGDSFGVLTSLFSGLAFAGIIITILLQKQELELQRQELRENREEFRKSADAQANNAKLVALSTLLNELNVKTEKISQEIGELEQQIQYAFSPNMDLSRGKRSEIHSDGAELLDKKFSELNREFGSMESKKSSILRSIETILENTGITI